MSEVRGRINGFSYSLLTFPVDWWHYLSSFAPGCLYIGWSDGPNLYYNFHKNAETQPGSRDWPRPVPGSDNFSNFQVCSGLWTNSSRILGPVPAPLPAPGPHIDNICIPFPPPALHSSHSTHQPQQTFARNLPISHKTLYLISNTSKIIRQNKSLLLV